MIQAKSSSAGNVLDMGHLLLKIDTLLRPPYSSPTWDEVLTHFIHNGLPAKAAACFFDHYEAKGWKKAITPPFVNWQAAAKGWIIAGVDAKPRTRIMSYLSGIVIRNHSYIYYSIIYPPIFTKISFMTQSVINFLETLYPMSDSLKATIAENLICKSFPKRSFLLKQGQVCKYIWFIKKGLVRAYYEQDGNEVTSWFMKENDVIISVSSFFEQLPSHEYIRTIERTDVAYISYDKLEEIYSRFVEFNIVGRVITQKYYTLWDKYIRDLRMQTSKERYIAFMRQYPDLVNRVPSDCLASFLGMTASTLSRKKAEQAAY